MKSYVYASASLLNMNCQHDYRHSEDSVALFDHDYESVDATFMSAGLIMAI